MIKVVGRLSQMSALAGLALALGCGGGDGAPAVADGAPGADTAPAGGSDATTPAGDAAVPAGDTAAPAGDAAVPAGGAVLCGPAPYLRITISAENPTAGAAGRAVPGTTVTFKLCPGVKAITGADGKVVVDLGAGSEGWMRFDAPGFLPWLLGEAALTPGHESVTATMLPQALQTTLVPGWRADRPIIYVQVQPGGPSSPAACRTTDGVILGIKEQPAATVAYRNSKSNPPTYAPGASTTDGWALITGLTESAAGVTLQASKPGCTYVTAYGTADDELVPIVRTPLQNGAISVQLVNVAR